MDRRAFLGTFALLATPFAAQAQQAGKTSRVGFLAGARREAPPISVPTFVGVLRELGYVEGQNLVIEFRDAHSRDRSAN